MKPKNKKKTVTFAEPLTGSEYSDVVNGSTFPIILSGANSLSTIVATATGGSSSVAYSASAATSNAALGAIPLISDDVLKGGNSKPLALCMMVKNEHKRIRVTMNTVKSFIKTFVFLDTGSTDDTIEIITNYCRENDIVLHLKETTFVDFRYSRNELLDYADTALSDPHYLLLMDCNDELKDGPNLATFANDYSGSASGFYLCQEWWNGTTFDRYFNVRLLLSHEGWRYKMRVHEYLHNPKVVTADDEKKYTFRINNITLYQDRTQDDDKTSKRFTRDKELLYEDHLDDPHEPRILFYLAQTCRCLGQVEDSYYYYCRRQEEVGFYEELFHSYFRCGEMSETLKHDWEESFIWYFKAFERFKRVEPLIKIIEHYLAVKDFDSAYMFCHMANMLKYPDYCILFVNKRTYTYTRWHLMGIVAFYLGKYEEGKEACLKAIEAENIKIDIDNLAHYNNKLNAPQIGAGISPTVVPGVANNISIPPRAGTDGSRKSQIVQRLKSAAAMKEAAINFAAGITVKTPMVNAKKTLPNDVCPCGSTLKYKKCCFSRDTALLRTKEK